ncbi:MAG: DUF2071 domain-containing protein [Gaiellaceae bacterium]
MRLRVDVRDLVIASWPTSHEAVARTLPPGLFPAEVDGRHLVSVVTLRYGGGRLGPIPVAPFSQLNLRVYVTWREEPAAFFLAARVTPPGLGGILFGAPYRPARLRFRPGLAEAPGLGLSLPYRPDGPGDPGALGAHELGIFEAAGLRAFRIRRGEVRWQRAVPDGPVRADLLTAHGFDVSGEPELYYAERASFEAQVPPRRLPRASSKSSGSSA